MTDAEQFIPVNAFRCKRCGKLLLNPNRHICQIKNDTIGSYVKTTYDYKWWI